MDEQPTPVIPAKVRTGAYVAGIGIGIGIGPSLAAFDLDAWTVVCSALAGACSALAFGYRPTRTDG